MKASEQKQMVALLQKEKEELTKRLEGIELILSQYEGLIEEPKVEEAAPAKPGKKRGRKPKAVVAAEAEAAAAPAKRGRKPGRKKRGKPVSDEEILDLFRHDLKKITRLPAVQKRFNTLHNTDRDIMQKSRKLKSENVLVAIKYNNVNKETFWGLPEWTTPDGKNFRPEFFNNDEMPAEVTSNERLK